MFGYIYAEHRNNIGRACKNSWAINGEQMAHKQKMARLKNYIINKYNQ
jgi:hypothetical protein